MDPMLELATQFLKADRPESNLKRKFPSDLCEDITKAIRRINSECDKRQNGSHSLQEILWELRDERAAEILADVFYAQPDIARRLCEIKPDLCPGFIRYLADEAHKEWLSERARKEWPRKREIHKFLEDDLGYEAHETFPAGLRNCLVEKPRSMEKLANQLKAALPFTLVLRKELCEVYKSRKKRLEPDANAEAAKRLNKIYRINTSLERLEVLGDHRLVKEQEDLARKEMDQMWPTRSRVPEPSKEENWLRTKSRKLLGQLRGKVSAWLRPRLLDGTTNRSSPPSLADPANHWRYPPRRGGTYVAVRSCSLWRRNSKRYF